MFHLYHHHDLDRLAELQAALLARRERPHPLTPDTVIVPNRGVGRWLQMQIAESEGLSANLDMPLLARFIWDLIPRCLPGAPEAADFGRERMRWHLYAVLPEVAAAEPAVASYLAGEPREVHRLQLADRLADVFDQYLIYRPQLLADWDAGRIADTAPDRWQAKVWRALTARLGTAHRAEILHRFIAGVDDESAVDGNRLPDTVYCFGLGHLPPDYVRFLYALSRRAEVHFLLPNPCDGYWGDIQRQRPRIEAPLPEEPTDDELAVEAGHPLLASLGKGIRNLLRVLYSEELAAIHEPELGEALAYEPPAGDALLSRVRSGIVRMAAPVESHGMSGDDVSVQVHACHGPLREAQVLQDQLLDLLRRDPDLTPRDIVVMMPEVTKYAPAIHSVFGAAGGGRHLPYSLSGRARNAGHPVVQSVQRVLDLPLSRWTASEILELAAVPAVMRRFGLDEAALATITDWIQEAGVRWGFDAGTRAHFGAGAFEQNTWRFGLDRLLLGLAQSDDDALTAGVAPWPDLEGGTTSALGGFWYLLDRLRSWQEALESPADAGTWQDRLNAMIDDLFATDPSDRPEQAALDEVRNAIAVLGEAAGCLGDEPLAWEAVRELLTAELTRPGERQPFLSGGITFCGLVPLRAVPFKVVCLLGMNDDAFPRQERNRVFNVLRARPRLGDHSVRDDDRLLFLQALTSARSVFYISYTGRDVAGGDELPPSPVVGEWLDFLHRHYFAGDSRPDFEARVITRQPMHPFSAAYFEAQPDQPRLFTFAREWQPASRAGHRDRAPAPAFVDGGRASPPEDGAIELPQLRRFFDHPAQYCLRDRLAVALESLEAEIDDTEPLQLDGLSAYRLRAALLEDAQAAGRDEVPEQPDALWRARGVLPPPPLEREPFAEQAGRVNALLPIWQAWRDRSGSAGWLDIDLTLDGERLVGRLANVWPDGLRILRPGRPHMKYKLRAWIDFLVYRAAGHEGALHLAGLDGNAAVEYRATIDADAARAQLTALLAIFRDGQRAPLLFMPGLAETYLYHLDRMNDPQYALDKANDKLTNSFHPSPEAQDPYFRTLLDGAPPLGDEPGETAFSELAETICGPPFHHLVTTGEEEA